MRSVEDSLQRLGMDRIDVLLIHDVDVWTHGSEEARLQRFEEVMGGGYRAMLKLREEGVVRAIGAGINEIQACEDFARAGDFDCFLLAGRYTLLEQAALDTLLPYCVGAEHLAPDRRPLQYRYPRHRRRRRAPTTTTPLHPRRSWTGWPGSRPSAPAMACGWPVRPCSSRWAIPTSPR